MEALAKANAALAHLKPVPEVLNLIRRRKAEGWGLREIARELNRLNIRTSKGKQWYASSVKNQLTSFLV